MTTVWCRRRPRHGTAGAGSVRHDVAVSSWWGRLWRVTIGPAAGVVLGVADSAVNHVPVVLGEVGLASADRGGWSQAAEFAGLILDAGWAWAATSVLVGWLVSRRLCRLASGPARGALAGGSALVCATTAYYGADLIFDGGSWWGWATRYWLIGSVVLGPLLGAAGALIPRRGPTAMIAALLVPAGAALQMIVLPPPAVSLMAGPVRLSIWIAAAVATALIVRRKGHHTVVHLAPADMCGTTRRPSAGPHGS
jgi:hypothetical protein